MQILEGYRSADDSARLCRHYRYACERMTRILAGWIALTPELSAKLLLGRHVWDSAQHTDAWGRRLPELRAHAQESAPPNDAFVAFVDAIEAPEEPGRSAERLTGVYRVLKPHLLAVYEAHRRQANPVYEPPTCRILDRCIEDERRHIAAGDTVIRHLAGTPEAQARIAAWQRTLEGLLERAHGVTGEGLPSVTPVSGGEVPLSDDAQEFVRLERATQSWSMPDELAGSVKAFGEALIVTDGVGLGRFLDASPDGAILLALRDSRVQRYRVVAFAKLGRHRIVKYRLEGPERAATINARWEQGVGGWRVGALDLVKVEPSQPARV